MISRPIPHSRSFVSIRGLSVDALMEDFLFLIGREPRRGSRGAATDSSPQRELWVQAVNVRESRRGDTRFSSAPPELTHRGSRSPGSRPGLLSSAPPVLSPPRTSTGRAKPPGEPPHGWVLTMWHLAGSQRSTGAKRRCRRSRPFSTARPAAAWREPAPYQRQVRVPHPFHPRDLWAVFLAYSVHPCPFVLLRG